MSHRPVSPQRDKSTSCLRRSGRFLLSALTFAALAGSSRAFAATEAYNGANAGNWNVAGNWSGGLAPVNGDTVNIGAFSPTRSGQSIFVTFNATNLSGAGLANLTLDSVNCQIEYLLINGAGNALIAANETIGNTITLNEVDQTAGTNIVSNLTLGNGSSSSGTYNLSGTGSLSVGNLLVGNAGSGSFTQSGGNIGLGNEIDVGGTTTSVGTYTMASGSMTFIGSSASLRVGRSGTGNFIQSGGALGYAGGSLFLGLNSGASGNYTLSGNATMSLVGNEDIGDFGSGNFTQNGGTNALLSSSTLTVGDNGVGTYAMNNGTLTAAAIAIGNNNSGSFTQSNGSVSTTSLAVNQHGFYSLSGGNLSLTSGGFITVVNSEFLQTGGTLTGTNATIGVGYTGSNATYNLNGGSISITNIQVGSLANGAFNHYNGTVTVANTLYVAMGGAAATYLFDAGSLNTGSSIVGDMGTGTFSQFGGTHTVGGTLTVAYLANSVGNYTLSSAFAPVTLSTFNETIGHYGNGTFTQSGGTHTVSGTLTLGLYQTGFFTLNAANTTNTLTVATEYIGYSGNGTFTQNGGTHTVTSALELGLLGGPVGFGTYTLNGGLLSLNPGVNETVGDDGIGQFTQTGGIHTIGGSLLLGSAQLGLAGTGFGNYLLTNGTVSASIGESVGGGNPGNFLQNGTSTNNASGSGVTITGGGSIYTLQAGTLNAAAIQLASGTMAISGGVANVSLGGITIAPTLVAFNFTGGTINTFALNTNGVPANFHWTGGLLNFTTNVTFDPSAPVTSTASAFGSVLALNSNMSLFTTGNQTLGGNATFTLTLNAGSSDGASGNLTVAPLGILFQNGGTLSQALFNQGTFNYASGPFNGQLVNSGTTNIFLPFTAPNGIINSGIISTLNLGVAVTANGSGLLNTGSIALGGGSITGIINNNALLFGYGTLTSTALVNTGVITQLVGPLALASTVNGFNNAGTLNLAPGLQLSLSGAAATSSGYINLNGGLLNNSASLVNSSSGVIVGPGQILGAFLNNGTVIPGAGALAITTSWTNNGYINLSGLGSAITGGAVTNAGTLQGAGSVGAPVASAGTIEAIGGTLAFTNSLTSTGTLRTATGTKLLMQGPGVFSTNAGLIDLAGGTFDNGGQPLNNLGTIAGYGVFSSGGAGLTNNANITFTGGTATINGNVTNTANHTLNIKYQPALFTGNVTNAANATIKTTSTTVTFTGTFTNLGNYLSDPSTNIFSNAHNAGAMSGSTGDVFTFSTTFTNTGTFANGGNLNVTGNITNSGTFTQTGPQSWSSSSTFTNTSGTATFGSNAKLADLTITAGTVDTTTSQLVIESSTKSAILAALQSAAATGNLTSSTLASKLALAIIDNGLLTTPFTTFGGLPVDTNSILLAPELLGDTNIDGHVDLNDLNTVLNNLGTTTTAWTSGNFDGAATIDLNDLNAVLNNLGVSFAGNATVLAAEALVAATPTPEPGSLLVACAVIVLTSPRRICRRRGR